MDQLIDPSPKRRKIDQINQSTSQTIFHYQSVSSPCNQSINQSIAQSSSQSSSQWTSQSNNQLISQSNNQPVSQSTSETLSQSTNQPVNQSLESLISPIFAQICGHLQLDEKCSLLSCISRSVSQLFDPSICCRNSVWIGVRTPNYPMTILPDAVSQQFASLSLGRLKYVQYATRLSLFLDWENDADSLWQHEIVSQINQSLKNNIMTSLAILEIGDTWSDLKTSEIIDSISINQHSLTELSIDVRVESTNSFPLMKWANLRHFTRLRSVHLGFPSCCVFTEQDVSALRALIDSLPDSIEELSLKGGSSEVFMLEGALEQMFRDAYLLPHLKRFCFLHFDIMRPLDLAHAMTSTIMNVTGKPRPLISGLRLVNLAHIAQLPLVDLFCEDVLDDASCVELCCSSMWPSLARVAIELPDEPYQLVDRTLSTLLELACQRNIADLKVSNEHEQLGLTESNLRYISRMTGLRCLDLRSAGRSLFANDDLLPLLPSGCWPHLQRLDIDTAADGALTLATLLSAAPNLQELMFSYSSVNVLCDSDASARLRPCEVLAQVLFYCPGIVRVYVNICDTNETLQDVQNAFMQYPLHVHSGQHLRALLLDGGELTRGALHWLLRQLSMAPHLTYLHAPITADTPLLELCLFRSLPHLRVFEQVRLVLEDSEGTLVNLYDELGAYIQYVPIYEPIPRLETMRGDRMFDSPPLEFDRAHKVTAWSDGHCGFYRAFRQGPDGSCSVCRQQFFDVLHSKLSDEEKARLTAWDTGNYINE